MEWMLQCRLFANFSNKLDPMTPSSPLDRRTSYALLTRLQGPRQIHLRSEPGPLNWKDSALGVPSF